MFWLSQEGPVGVVWLRAPENFTQLPSLDKRGFLAEVMGWPGEAASEVTPRPVLGKQGPGRGWV